jgi:hypothetical protein
MLVAALNVSVTPVEAKEIVCEAVPYVGLAKVLDFLHITNVEWAPISPRPPWLPAMGLSGRAETLTVSPRPWDSRANCCP